MTSQSQSISTIQPNWCPFISQRGCVADPHVAPPGEIYCKKHKKYMLDRAAKELQTKNKKVLEQREENIRLKRNLVHSVQNDHARNLQLQEEEDKLDRELQEMQQRSSSMPTSSVDSFLANLLRPLSLDSPSTTTTTTTSTSTSSSRSMHDNNVSPRNPFAPSDKGSSFAPSGPSHPQPPPKNPLATSDKGISIAPSRPSSPPKPPPKNPFAPSDKGIENQIKLRRSSRLAEKTSRSSSSDPRRSPSLIDSDDYSLPIEDDNYSDHDFDDSDSTFVPCEDLISFDDDDDDPVVHRSPKQLSR